MKPRKPAKKKVSPAKNFGSTFNRAGPINPALTPVVNLFLRGKK